jgi:hypothetical protein
MARQNAPRKNSYEVMLKRREAAPSSLWKIDGKRFS